MGPFVVITKNINMKARCMVIKWGMKSNKEKLK